MVVSLRRLTRHPARLAGARPFGGNTPRGPVLTPEATRPRGHHGDRRADRGDLRAGRDERRHRARGLVGIVVRPVPAVRAGVRGLLRAAPGCGAREGGHRRGAGPVPGGRHRVDPHADGLSGRDPGVQPGRPGRLSEAVVFRRCARPARGAGPGDRWMVAALGRVPLHPEDVLPRTQRSYKNLNMRSTRSERESPDDRSTKARIRDAAIDCVAEHGVAATTARRVAAAAGVSTGLVIHHFGSMEGLRSECDEYVAAAIRRRTTESMSAGLDPLAALRDADPGPLMSYLVRVLAEDSPSVNALVDESVDRRRV